MIHVSVFVCVIPSNISVSLAQKSDDNKTKLHNKPFLACMFVSPNHVMFYREFAFCFFINNAYICM